MNEISPIKMDAISHFTTEKKNSGQSALSSPFEIKKLLGRRNDAEQSEAFICQINYEILIVKKGKGHFLFNTNKIDILDNTVYLVSPGQIYQMQSGEALSGYKITFTEKALNWNQSFNRSLFYSNHVYLRLPFSMIPLEKDLFANIELIVLNMINEVSGFNQDKEELLNSFFKIIIIYLSRKSFASGDETALTSRSSIVKRFFNLLNNEFKKCKSVSEYACHLAVTPNYMSEAIKRETGYCATHHIQQRIIMEAKNMSFDPAINMKTIAYALGFEDSAHFSKFFKKYSGVNFSAYKRSLPF